MLVQVAVAAGGAGVGAAGAGIAVCGAAAAVLVDIDGAVVLQRVARPGQLILVDHVHRDHQGAAAYRVGIGGRVMTVLFMGLVAEQRFEEVRDLRFVFVAVHRDVRAGAVGCVVGMDIGAFGAHRMDLLAGNAPRHQVAAGAIGIGQRGERCYQCVFHGSPHVVSNNRVCEHGGHRPTRRS